MSSTAASADLGREWSAARYRRLAEPEDLVSFQVRAEQSDLMIYAERTLSEQARALLLEARKQVCGYIAAHPEFQSAFAPLPADRSAPPVVSAMLAASRQAGVGPMAAVAGAIADYVGRGLLAENEEVIVENGGDVFLRSKRHRETALLAERSSLVGLRILLPRAPEGLGVATSAGTIGHSLSFGNADAAMVIAESGALADALATAIGNAVRTANHLADALKLARNLGARGAVIVADDHVGAWGALEILG